MKKYSIEPYKEEGTAHDFRNEDAYIRAKKRVEELVGFYWHIAVYIVVNIFLILLIALNTEEGFFSFGPYATAVFWGIGLVFHFLGVFGPNFIFGEDWERRKIEEYMEKERKTWE